MQTPTSIDQLGVTLGWLATALILAIAANIYGILVGYSKSALKPYPFGQAKGLHVAAAMLTILAFAAGAVGLLHFLNSGFVDFASAIAGGSAGALYVRNSMFRVVPKGQLEARRGRNVPESDDAGEVYFAGPGGSFFIGASETVVATFPQLSKIVRTGESLQVEATDGTFVIKFRFDAKLHQDEGSYRDFLVSTASPDLGNQSARESYIGNQVLDRLKSFLSSLAESYSMPIKSGPAQRPAPNQPAPTLPFPSPDEFNKAGTLRDMLNDLEQSLEEEFGLAELRIRLVEYELSSADQAALSEAFQDKKAVRVAIEAMSLQGIYPPNMAALEAAYRQEKQIPSGGPLTLKQREEFEARVKPFQDAFQAQLERWMILNSDSALFEVFKLDVTGLQNMRSLSITAPNLSSLGGGGRRGQGGAQQSGPGGQAKQGQGGGKNKKRQRRGGGGQGATTI